MTTFPGNDGLDYPAVGFGTYLLNGAAGMDIVRQSIHSGYRLLDSAVNYENEGAVGRAVRSAGVPREQVKVASKLPGRHHGHDQAIAAVEESVYRSGLDQLDLYLIHWPNPIEDRYVEAWTALVEARERGLVRSIGVCNFLPEHLDRIIAATGIPPVINQIEMHPYFPQVEQRAYNSALGIVTQAWSPLGRAGDLLADPVLVEIAARTGLPVGQLVLAWAVQSGAMPLPKASSAQRQRENLAAADVLLDDDDLAAITALGRPDGRTNDQDPSRHQEF